MGGMQNYEEDARGGGGGGPNLHVSFSYQNKTCRFALFACSKLFVHVCGVWSGNKHTKDRVRGWMGGMVGCQICTSCSGTRTSHAELYVFSLFVSMLVFVKHVPA